MSKAHSTFQPADKCPAQPCGDSKNPFIEAGPLSLHRCIPLSSFCNSKLFTPFGTISSNLETIRSSFHEHFQPRDRFIFGLSWRWCFCHTCLRSPFYLLDTVCFHWSTPPHRSRRYCCDMCPALGNYFEVVPGSGIFHISFKINCTFYYIVLMLTSTSKIMQDSQQKDFLFRARQNSFPRRKLKHLEIS